MRISVVIPSYRRTDVLGSCIEALLAQDRQADEVIVVVREDDHESRELVGRYDAVRCVLVTEPGAVHAMAKGALASDGDVICFSDDDARAHRDWLARIEAVLEGDAGLAAVGGRDLIHELDGSPRPTTLSEEVGVFHWYGRLVGNHHRGTGPARDVDVLKGVNSAYRREFLALPEGLRGAGTQIHFEVVMGSSIIKRGGRLSYDPAILVDHYPAKRQDADQRDAPPASAIAGHAYNLTTAAAVRSPWRLIARVTYATTVGDAAMPGLLRALLALARGDLATAKRLGGALSGNLAAARDWVLGRRPRYAVPAPRR